MTYNPALDALIERTRHHRAMRQPGRSPRAERADLPLSVKVGGEL
jgi:hypothetical protein